MKVSVLTPLYNTNPAHLREAIESILAQTFKDFEFILLNDSPDNKELKKIVKSYDDPRIIYAENERNLGISAARNKLLDMARGEYLAIFDHDDISLPTRLEKQVKFLDANPEIGVLSSDVEVFPKDKKTIFRYPRHNLEIKRALVSTMVITHTAAMLRKSVLMDNNIRYEQQFSPAEDYILYIRLMDKTMFCNLPEVLVKYRMFEGNTSNKQKAKMANADALIRNIAQKEYPFFTQKNFLTSNPRKRWVYIFGVPLIKIKCREGKKRILLFGFIPLFSAKNI